MSAFSNALADAVKAYNRHEQERNIDLIKDELQAMTNSCNVQKNVNMTIKEGSMKIRELVAAID